jgi:uncharacterized membrane protein YagU involved in acid resistance
MVMDILLMGVLLAVRNPVLLCFTIVGDTVSRFFSLAGLQLAGGVPTGIVTHYLIGPLVGALFGIAVTKFPALRVKTPKKGAVAAVLYVEILSQPLLVTTPILLKMTASETLLWFGGSIAMHFVLGIILGGIVGYGLRVQSRRDLSCRGNLIARKRRSDLLPACEAN